MSVQRESQSNRRRLIRLSISAAANGLSRNRLATIAATTTMTLMLMVLASVLVIRAGLDAAISRALSPRLRRAQFKFKSKELMG